MRSRSGLMLLSVGALVSSACSVYSDSLLTATTDAVVNGLDGGAPDSGFAATTGSGGGEPTSTGSGGAGGSGGDTSTVAGTGGANAESGGATGTSGTSAETGGSGGLTGMAGAGGALGTGGASAGAGGTSGTGGTSVTMNDAGPGRVGTCTDGVLNGGETTIDCGGDCPTTNKCTTGAACSTSATCLSGLCRNQVCSLDYALRFSGAQAFSFPRPVSDDFTIELWVKTTQTATSTQWYGGAWLFQADVMVNSNDYGVSLVNGKLGFGTGNPDFGILSNTSINTGKWVHLAATRVKSTGMLSVFVNGVLEKSAASTNTGTLDGNNYAHVGSSNLQYNGFIGELDEVRAWRIARPAAEIASTMNKRLSGSEPGLVSYWRLDEGKGRTLSDSSSTKAAGTWTAPEDPVFVVSGVPFVP